MTPLGSGSSRSTRVAVLVWLLAAGATQAQEPDREINVFRYVFGVDVPQSPALVGLGAAPELVLLGSNHKPVIASFSTSLDDAGRFAGGLAVDVSPYFACR